jgi:hypothetical protein
MKTKAVRRYVICALLLVVANLVVLDYLVIKQHTSSYVLGDATTSAAAAACPAGCLTAINKLASASTSTTVKDYYIPLGTGANATSDWADVAGASATVDTAQYPKIKKVVFEATLAVPTGNQVAYVRLFNETDGHPVWYSEMSMNTTGPTLLTTQAITLDRGSKLYKVQMKTQLKYTANLNQSRIHITTY